MELPSALLGPSLKKKNPPRKKFLIFQEMELSDSKIKKILIFSQKKAFHIFPEMELPYISGNGGLKNISYIFSKESFSYISGNGNPEEILQISGNRTFLYFLKKLFFLYFGKGIFRTLKQTQNLWYIQYPRHIQNTVKHLLWNAL